MITNADSISDVISIFHDGTIRQAHLDGDKLKLQVNIAYLAKRVNPEYKSFHIELDGFCDAEFSTWPRTLGAEKEVITEFSRIFASSLDILSASVKEGGFEVICNIPSIDCDYCGGELFFRAKSATILDEANKEYSVEELRKISKDYWDAWKAHWDAVKKSQAQEKS